jgi:alkanesulfonate monooxygenase SsuD/methylene tetrahydromethanopterin reductase-like flavin-dependent oxidoreductase (luciferase family)
MKYILRGNYGFRLRLFWQHANSVQIHPAVALAEKRGFTHAWLYDSQMLASDVYAALALCAEHTKTIFWDLG